MFSVTGVPGGGFCDITQPSPLMMNEISVRFKSGASVRFEQPVKSGIVSVMYTGASCVTEISPEWASDAAFARANPR